MAARKKVYRLYAMQRTRKNEEAAYATRFYRICPGYILLYLTGRKRPEGTVEVAGEDLKRLTDGDRLWLTDCNMVILAETAAKSGMTPQETEKRWTTTLDRLERELAAERAKREGSGADEHSI